MSSQLSLLISQMLTAMQSILLQLLHQMRNLIPTLTMIQFFHPPLDVLLEGHENAESEVHTMILIIQSVSSNVQGAAGMGTHVGHVVSQLIRKYDCG